MIKITHNNRYYLSIIILGIILYLSFYNPKGDSKYLIPYLDKIAHFCMYTGFSFVIWLETISKRKSLTLASCTVIILIPVAISGIIEIGQEYLTSYRSGDIWDFVANTCGVLFATIIVSLIFNIKRKIKK